MSAMELQFRTSAFGGFQKQDVLTYLENTGREHAERVEALQKELSGALAAKATLEEEHRASLRRVEELEQQNARLAETLEAYTKDLEEVRADREARDRRIAELEGELAALRAQLAKAAPSAEAYERIKNRTAGVELEAHRRAQEIEDEAREKARQARAELEQWIYKVQAGDDRLRTDVDATIPTPPASWSGSARAWTGWWDSLPRGTRRWPPCCIPMSPPWGPGPRNRFP